MSGVNQNVAALPVGLVRRPKDLSATEDMEAFDQLHPAVRDDLNYAPLQMDSLSFLGVPVHLALAFIRTRWMELGARPLPR